MERTCDVEALKATISQWPGVVRYGTSTYNIYLVEGRKFCWIPKSGTMVQIAPPLGRDEKTRRLKRTGASVEVVRNRTGEVEARYHDPRQRLESLWSHPGFRPSRTTQVEAESLVQQAYRQAQANRGGRVPGTERELSPSARRSGEAPSTSSNRVVQVPMEAELVQALDSWSHKFGRSRANVIREACRRYLAGVEREELDRIYREGYERVPEEPIMALTQASLLAEVLPSEEW